MSDHTGKTHIRTIFVHSNTLSILDADLFWLHRIESYGKVKVKMLLCIIKHHTMKTFDAVEVQLQVFLT
jgi:hypothetical protein